MKHAQWSDVFFAADTAAKHFEGAMKILLRDDFDYGEEAGYTNVMAFFHAMQSGHTALEDALLRTLRILGEDKPTGENWHSELIKRCSNPTAEHPEILPAELAAAAQETRSFRHRATHSTVQFDSDLTRSVRRRRELRRGLSRRD